MFHPYGLKVGDRSMAWDDKIYFHLCFTHVFVSTQVKKNHRWGEKRVYNCLFAIVFMGTMKQLATNITNVNQWTDMSPMVTNGLTCHQCLPMDWHDFRIGVWNTKAKCWTEEQILNWLLDSWIKASCLMLWVFICTKKIQNGSRNSWVMAFSPWEVLWFHCEQHGTKRNHSLSICTKKI